MRFGALIGVTVALTFLLSWFRLTCGSAELVVPLIPVAALHAVAANLPLVAGAALLLKGAATTGAYLYLRNKGVIDVNVNFDHELGPGGKTVVAGVSANSGHHAYAPAEEHHGYATSSHDHAEHEYVSEGLEGGYSQTRPQVLVAAPKHRRNQGPYQRANHGQRPKVQAAVPSERVAVAVNPRLEKLLEMDRLGCGFRLMCELASLPQSRREQDEQTLLTLYGNESKGQEGQSGKLSFGYASSLGRMTQDWKVCSTVYSRCPHSRHVVMNALRAATSSS